jgi:hypothetical protein
MLLLRKEFVVIGQRIAELADDGLGEKSARPTIELSPAP